MAAQDFYQTIMQTPWYSTTGSIPIPLTNDALLGHAQQLLTIQGATKPAPKKEDPEVSAQKVAELIEKELPNVLIEEVSEVEGSEAAFDEYVALASKLGISTRPIEKVGLERYLQKMEIPIYNMDKVRVFLNKLQVAGTPHTHWAWVAVKKYDVQSHSYSNGDINYSNIYSEKIPLFALKRMDTILKKFKGAHFFVSQLNMVKPDPFMAVRVGDAPLIAIAHWDEPGFQLVDKKK